MQQIAVLNAGIGGNRVLHDGLGPSGASRFERDVLSPPGARWAIVLEGVNDLGTAPPAQAGQVAEDLIAAYGVMIGQAHLRGLRIFGATILPFGGSFYDKPEREAARQKVNAWIRKAGNFDGTVDGDAALRDPGRPSALRGAADSGDHLHLNDAGYAMLAESVDLTLFSK